MEELLKSGLEPWNYLSGEIVEHLPPEMSHHVLDPLCDHQLFRSFYFGQGDARNCYREGIRFLYSDQTNLFLLKWEWFIRCIYIINVYTYIYTCIICVRHIICRGCNIFNANCYSSIFYQKKSMKKHEIKTWICVCKVFLFIMHENSSHFWKTEINELQWSIRTYVSNMLYFYWIKILFF